MRWQRRCISIAVLLILALSIVVSDGKIGYSIGASAGGTSWIIDRYTQNLSLNLVENIAGSGNFSRYNRIEGNSGMKYLERSSAVSGGTTTINQTSKLICIEGPVYITYALQDSMREIENPETEYSRLSSNGTAKIMIDEFWPSFFSNYKKITYRGRGIKNLERYNNNEEIISTYTDSWMLTKESLYSYFNNRTKVEAKVTPSGVLEEYRSNESSIYLLEHKSIGSLSHIEFSKEKPLSKENKWPAEDSELHLSQDYKGHVEMKLKITRGRSFLPGPLTQESDEYLPCCTDAHGISSWIWDAPSTEINENCIFNCAFYPTNLQRSKNHVSEPSP
ncbi:MAG: hypothetical protein HPY61_01695 [Methanotrichaceae archaeon]|nr:hypothetical protein [Methanotrichaceae archaeon]